MITMKINYVADDGTIFDNERECLKYENNLKTMRENLICLDENLRPINSNDPNFETNVYFILAKNDFACEVLEEIFDLTGISIPDKGFKPNIAYWWNDNEMDWFILQQELKELKEKVEFCENALAIIHSS